MSDLHTSARMALEALELAQKDVHWELNSPTRKHLRKIEVALRAALEQPEQEPIGQKLKNGNIRWANEDAMFGYVGPLYATPPDAAARIASLEQQLADARSEATALRVNEQNLIKRNGGKAATADEIISTLYERKGFDDWWDGIDEDIQKEIKNEINGGKP